MNFLIEIFICDNRKVADDSAQDDFTNIIRKLNEIVKNDERIDISMLTIGDGVTFCLKK